MTKPKLTRENCPTCALPFWKHPHCRECHLSWTSLVQAHCVVCCRQFSTDTAFKDHFTKFGEHVDPVGKASRTYGLDENGVWRRTDGAPRIF